MTQFKHVLSKEVLKTIDEINEEGLKKKVRQYLDLLDENGYKLPSQYMDKIEGYKNLFELRPHFHNIEFRMIFYWQENTAFFVLTFYERGSKKKNQRDYDTANMIKKMKTEGKC